MEKYTTLFFDICSGFIYIIQLAIILCSSLAVIVMPVFGVYKIVVKKYRSGIPLLVLWGGIIISLIISGMLEITMVVGVAGLLLATPFFGVYKLIKKKRVLGTAVLAVWFAAISALIIAHIIGSGIFVKTGAEGNSFTYICEGTDSLGSNSLYYIDDPAVITEEEKLTYSSFLSIKKKIRTSFQGCFKRKMRHYRMAD